MYEARTEAPKRPIRAALIAEMMTPMPVTVDAGATILAAARLMLGNDIGGLPVLHHGLVAGIITRTDLVARLVPPERVWWWRVFADQERLARECQRAGEITVGQIMSQPAVIAYPDDTIETAAGLLHRHGIGRLPVVDHDRLVGIVTNSDLLRALVQGCPGLPSGNGRVQ
jgi:CBS domain-containing protein